MTPTIPTNIGKYEVEKILGRGGMGIVYLGFDRHLGRRVAIKTLTEGFMQDPEMLKRFYREATKTGALMHPNIVIVYDLGEQDGFPYIVMEYVPGTPLDQIIQTGRPMSIISKLKVMEQVCLALGYAHRNDVIHRDVKPANVIVQQDNIAKLLDFGIAHHEVHDREQRLTKKGNVLGTMQYMAPERWRGAPFDGRSDIFSAGILLYELLSSRLPFNGENASLFHQMLNVPPPPLGKYLTDYPVVLDLIIQRALAKDPNDRHHTAEEMAAEVSAVAEQLRKEKGAEMFRQAEQFVRTEDYLKARDVLSQVVQLDSKNVDARKLLATVQSSLAVRQRAERIRQLKIQADSALEEKDYSQATSLLEQILHLDPSDVETPRRIESVRQQKRTAEDIDGYLQKADRAQKTHHFEEAHSLLQKALQLDSTDSRIKVALHNITADINEEARQRKIKHTLESVHNDLRARRYTAALQLLNEATLANPDNAEIARLLQTVKSAQDQEQRRGFIEQIQSEASAAITAPQITAASEKVENSLQRMPGEPSLLKLKAQLDKQLTDLQIRSKVDETVQRCYPLMESSPQQALALVQQQLRELPTQERLLILQSAIEERIAHLKLEEVRTNYMARAHEAIRSQRYHEATQVLENCLSEGILSDEITDLLEFARHEARRGERRALIETTVAKANTLIEQGSYDQVISHLGPMLAQHDEPALRVVLEKARAEHNLEQQRLNSILATVKQFGQFQQWEEAITFLEQQPKAARETDAIKSAMRELSQANDQEHRVLQAAGAAYSALHRTDLSFAYRQTEALRREPTPLELTIRLVQSVEVRVIHVADQLLATSLSDARHALEQHDPKRALDLLAKSSEAKDYANLEARHSWRDLKKLAGRAKLLGRVGIRFAPSDLARK